MVQWMVGLDAGFVFAGDSPAINTRLAMLGFLAPWMAWGTLAAIGLPLLAHLLSRSKYRQVIFPATRLIQQAAAETSRIEKPRNRLLMLLRFLLLVLIVLAFMRPQWTPDVEASHGEQGIALVILIDASASMQRTTGGVSLYDRAKQQAQKLIDQLAPARDIATVIRVDHAPKPLLPEPPARRGLLTERLLTTEPGYTHADWAQANAIVQRLAQKETRPIRLVTISDQQGTPPQFAADHLRIEGPTNNTAVRLIDVSPYPPITGRPIQASVELTHFGDQPRTVQLQAALGGQTQIRPVSLSSGETRSIELTLDPPQTGKDLLRVSIDPGDAIAADDQAGLPLTVREGWRAIVFYDAPAAKPVADRFAMMLRPGEVAGAALPTVEVIPSKSAADLLNTADPEDLRTVINISTRQLDPAYQQAVISYVNRGGGAVRLTVHLSPQDRPRMRSGLIDFSLEPLRVFEGPARAGLANLTWPHAGPRPAGGSGYSLLRSEDGTSLIHATPIGRGKRISLGNNFSPEPDDLLAQPAFVVLFNELCRYASPGPAPTAPARPGDRLPETLLNATNTRFPADAQPDAETFTAPGPYASLDAQGSIQTLLFAELDPAESDTSPPASWSSPQDLSSNDASISSIDTTASTLRPSVIELWPYLILAALGLVATESLLLRSFANTPAPPTLQGGAA